MGTLTNPRNLIKNLLTPREVQPSKIKNPAYIPIDRIKDLSVEKKKKLVPVLIRTKPDACYLEHNKIIRNSTKGRMVVKELSDLELRFYYLFGKKMTLYEIALTVSKNNKSKTEPVFEDVSRFFFQLVAKRVCYATLAS